MFSFGLHDIFAVLINFYESYSEQGLWTAYPAEHSTVSESQNPSIDEFNTV